MDCENQENKRLLGQPPPYEDSHGVPVQFNKNKYGTTTSGKIQRNSSSTGSKSKLTCFYITLVSSILLIFVVVVLLTCTIGYSQCLDGYGSTAQLGCDGDTVVIGRVSSFVFSRVTIYECLKRNDYTHVGDIYLEETKNLVTTSVFTVHDSKVYRRSYPSKETGLVDYLYLLKGSKVEYTICLASENAGEETGRLYIFDDQTSYWNYASNFEEGEKHAVYTTTINIGASNQTICNTVRYDVTYSTYLFITSRTPASIHYNYSLATYAKFYNHSKYTPVCQTGGGPCNIELSGGFFHPQDLQILAYIEKPIAADPFTTHICMTPHISSTFAAVVLTGLFATCVLFVLVICLAVFGVRGKHRGHRKQTMYNNHMIIN